MRTHKVSRLRPILYTAMLLLVMMGLVSTQAVQAATLPIPTITGPIPSTPANLLWPGLTGTTNPGEDPSDYGYITDEYFVSGTAGTATNNSYTIRILVRHPEKAKNFSGIVLAEAMHFNGTAVEFSPMRLSIMVRGHVSVEIAAQAPNVATLKNFNSSRYQDIKIPSGSTVTSEIIGQVGTLLKSNFLAGARHFILMGSSNTSQALETYQSQIHFQYRMPNGSPIFDGYFATSTLSRVPMMVVDVPTIQMPTQTEVTSYAAAAGGPKYRQPDNDNPGFRIYEVAGLSHINTRDSVQFEPNPCSLPMVTGHEFPWGAMASMGLNHLVEWVDKGTVPPHAPYIATYVTNTTTGAQGVQLDAYGNAVGGVRNPYVDVPVYQYAVPNFAPAPPPPARCASPMPCFLCSLASYQEPLPEETLESLYKNRGQYISQINHTLKNLMNDGWFLPEYEDVVKTDAQAFSKTVIKP